MTYNHAVNLIRSNGGLARALASGRWSVERLAEVVAHGRIEQSLHGRRALKQPLAIAYRDVPRHVRSIVALTAAAYGRWAIDAVSLDIGDTAVLRQTALDAAALGFSATACIHPSQVPIVRDAYRPSAKELKKAQQVVDANQSGGVLALEGIMVDEPVLRQAKAVLARAAAAGRPLNSSESDRLTSS